MAGTSSRLLYAGMLVCDLSVMFVNIRLQTTIVTRTPESLRGRVDSVMVAPRSAAAPIGLLAFGSMAELTSTRSAVWVGAVLLGAMILVLTIRIGGMGRRPKGLQSQDLRRVRLPTNGCIVESRPRIAGRHCRSDHGQLLRIGSDTTIELDLERELHDRDPPPDVR